MKKFPEYIVFATDRRDPKSYREKALLNVAAKFNGLAHTVELVSVDAKTRVYRMQVAS